MNLIKTATLVKDILTKYPETRDNDYLLWLKVIEVWSVYNGCRDYAKMITVDRFLRELQFMDCPNMGTVGRARRKLQAEYPHLRSSAVVEAERAEAEEQFRQFAHSHV